MQGDLRDLVEMVVARAGLIEALEAESTDEARGRADNIREFFGVVGEFAESARGRPTCPRSWSGSRCAPTSTRSPRARSTSRS